MAVAVGKAPVPPAHVRSLWEAFRERVCMVVQECNSVAGETMWRLMEEPSRLCITGESRSLELSLDPQKRAVYCEFGPAGERWTVHLRADGATFRRGATVYNVSEAVDAILDHLIC